MQLDLTRGPISKHIKNIAIPASIGFFFNTMYNVVDTYYAGLVSTQALAAIGLSFPIFFVIIAIGSGVSTGATALISNALGEKKKTDAEIYATQSITYSFILSIMIGILGLLVSPFLFGVLGASGEYLSVSLDYINVIFYGTLFFMMTFTLNAILNAMGDAKPFRNYLIVGFFLNIILDPALMFGWWILPELGLAGVAWATVIIQMLGMIYLGYKVFRTHLFCKECENMIMPRKKPFLDLTKQGFPASLNMMTVALGIFVITYFLSIFGKDTVAGYSAAVRIEQIALLPTMGLNIATLAIIGQNNGARRYDRVKEALRLCLRYGLMIITAVFIPIFIMAEKFMGIFTEDPTVIVIGVSYLRVAFFISWAYVMIFMVISALQGLKCPNFAVWIGVFRQIIAPLAIFSLFIYAFGLGYRSIWWGLFIIIWISAAITIAYYRHVIKRLQDKNV